MRIESEIINAFKKAEVLEAQLERTLRQFENSAQWDLLDDLRYAKDKIIDAKEALENRIPSRQLG